MAQSFIFFGKSSKRNFEEAQAFATDYLAQQSSIAADALKRHVQNETYPNLFVLRKPEEANEITIDEARSIIEFLSQTPSIKGNRAVIIDSAEFLSQNSANCLLKILEEPPLDAIMVLTTKKLMSIIPTIRSRCFKIRINVEINDISNYENVKDYINDVLAEQDKKDFIDRFLKFIENSMQGIQEFSKTIENSDLDLICEICFLYSYFSFHKNPNLNQAQTTLDLQNIANLAKKTYPDKQSLLTAIWCIFKNNQ